MIFVLLDEGVSHKIAAFAKNVGIPSGVQLDTILSLQQKGLPDEDWMTLLSKRGRPADLKIAFSANNFTDPQRALAETLRLTLFSTPRMFWRPLKRLGQAAYILRWLPRMLELAAAHPAGAQFRLPSHFRIAMPVHPRVPITSRKTVRSGRPRSRRKVPLFD